MSEREKYIVHIDMDAFFASVEQRDNPELVARPVIVGADAKKGTGRGVVSTCSYEARRYGIHSAMPISTAYKRCPSGVFLEVDMEKYSRVSRQVFACLEAFTPEIEPVGIDEAFLDITGSWHLFGSPVETCLRMREAVRKAVSLSSSIGLAPNKMTAKIASDLKKPDGFVVVTKDKVKEFLSPLPIEKLWGIGAKTTPVLKNSGVRTIGDLAKKRPEELIKLIGSYGWSAWELANGIDPREVEIGAGMKSVSNEHTFGKDTDDADRVKGILMALSEKVSGRLRSSGLKARTITLKIRFSDFGTFTRAETVSVPTNFTDAIYSVSLSKMEEFDLSKKKIRLLGVRASGLSDSRVQSDLFDENSALTQKKERLYKALDLILNKFGESALRHARNNSTNDPD
jgi:nucleotidyltransferase/DNA polymerase involved in DNA repair